MQTKIVSRITERIRRRELYGQVVGDAEAAVIVPNLLDRLDDVAERELAVDLVGLADESRLELISPVALSRGKVFIGPSTSTFELSDVPLRSAVRNDLSKLDAPAYLAVLAMGLDKLLRVADEPGSARILSLASELSILVGPASVIRTKVAHDPPRFAGYATDWIADQRAIGCEMGSTVVVEGEGLRLVGENLREPLRRREATRRPTDVWASGASPEAVLHELYEHKS